MTDMPGKKVHTDDEALALRQIEAMRAHLHRRLREEFDGNMSAAADAVGLAKSSFYRHFPQGPDVKLTTGEVPLRILVVVARWLEKNRDDPTFVEVWNDVTADL